MTENRKNNNAQDYILEALSGRIYKDSEGSLYTFEGIGEEECSDHTFVFKSHNIGKNVKIKINQLETLVEVKSISD